MISPDSIQLEVICIFTGVFMALTLHHAFTLLPRSISRLADFYQKRRFSK